MTVDSTKEFDVTMSVLDHISDGVYIVNTNRKIIYWNKAAEKITGYKARETVGIHCWENIVMHMDGKGNSLCKEYCPSSRTIAEGQIYKFDTYIKHKSGHRIPVTVQTIPVRNYDGDINRCIHVFSQTIYDMGYAKRMKQLDKMALLDPLTGLATMQYFEANLNDRFNELSRYNWPFGLACIGIDNIIKISKKYGSYARDEIIKLLARTIIYNTRPFDTCTRWGKEGFILMLVNVDEEQLSEVLERLRILTAQSYITFITETISTTISIGSVIAQKDCTTDALIKHAEELMYHSRAHGGNRISKNLFS